MHCSDRKSLAALENDLVERFKNGEDGSFAGLAELYKDRIHQFVICVLGPDRETEDIAQEAFIQIYRSLNSFRGGSSFSTWAYAVTRNVCRRHLRDRGREAGFPGEEEEDGAPYEVPESGHSPEPALESEETRALVRAEIEALSPIHRSVIFLSCWERKSYEEMAQILDIPVGTVRSRLHNALAALSRRLKTVLAEEKLP